MPYAVCRTQYAVRSMPYAVGSRRGVHNFTLHATCYMLLATCIRHQASCVHTRKPTLTQSRMDRHGAHGVCVRIHEHSRLRLQVCIRPMHMGIYNECREEIRACTYPQMHMGAARCARRAHASSCVYSSAHAVYLHIHTHTQHAHACLTHAARRMVHGA
jgi:hypothetical protein